MHRILLVDDSPTIRRMVRVSLAEVARGGFAEASSGLEAIEQLTLGPASLMVLDLNMPDMHGIDVLKFMRSHPRLRECPVIVLTTRGDASSREAALAAGASAYVTKPFVPHVLAHQARVLLEGQHTHVEGTSRVE